MLRQKIPSDQTVEDARQDAAVFILEAEERGKTIESHLVVFAFGKLRDKYARLFEHNSRTMNDTIRQTNVRASRRTNDPDTTLRGSYGREGLFAADPAERLADAEDADTRMDIADAIARLPIAQQSAWNAVIVEGMTQEAYAATRGTTQAAVSQLIARARARLRVTLKDYE